MTALALEIFTFTCFVLTKSVQTERQPLLIAFLSADCNIASKYPEIYSCHVIEWLRAGNKLRDITVMCTNCGVCVCLASPFRILETAISFCEAVTNSVEFDQLLIVIDLWKLIDIRITYLYCHLSICLSSGVKNEFWKMMLNINVLRCILTRDFKISFFEFFGSWKKLLRKQFICAMYLKLPGSYGVMYMST